MRKTLAHTARMNEPDNKKRRGDVMMMLNRGR